VPAQSAALYIVGIYEHTVLVGRISAMNKARAEEILQRRPGPDGEQLQEWQSGTRWELLGTYPELVAGWTFDRADEAYAVARTNQISYPRPDR